MGHGPFIIIYYDRSYCTGAVQTHFPLPIHVKIRIKTHVLGWSATIVVVSSTATAHSLYKGGMIGSAGQSATRLSEGLASSPSPKSRSDENTKLMCRHHPHTTIMRSFARLSLLLVIHMLLSAREASANPNVPIMLHADDNDVTSSSESSSSESSLLSKSDRVIGGTKAEDGRYPYSVSLQNYGGHFCGGSLIGRDVVLTAAHCVEGESTGFTIVVGSDDVDEGRGIRVRKVLVHSDYDDKSNKNDFALVFLRDSVSNIPLIRLNDDDSYPAPGRTTYTMGWGDTDPGSSQKLPDQLRVTNVEAISNQECKNIRRGGESYGNWISDDMICADTKGQDACQGDSGGLLITRGNGPQSDRQVGVVSWGIGCAFLPGVYARVSKGYDWIRETVCDESNDTGGSSLCGTPNPTPRPTRNPTKRPTNIPTKFPTRFPTRQPTRQPTNFPTLSPTTAEPTLSPTDQPSAVPSGSPSGSPSTSPTGEPSSVPSSSGAPSSSPSMSPSLSLRPTSHPSDPPSVSQSPSGSPSSVPSSSSRPSESPSTSSSPSSAPSITPTISNGPTFSLEPSTSPSTGPSSSPSTSGSPSSVPSSAPSSFPSDEPTTTTSPSVSVEPTASSAPSSIIPWNSLLIPDVKSLVTGDEESGGSSVRTGRSSAVAALLSGLATVW
eukprot:CAMPEP_0181095950 /NCGR_PEP_ID=MMETSP1071-20121207/10779_1 /TAXON_ID=35127 /ORGANISM="Thalassiosira sp., Strain NH16" /LENGTH=662 /DNA_ID=CAMNT_0023178339 /DNA_START=134 /DNA_END=2119 /DNA_ORIENTATION=+